jgi:predicted nucleic acid-binding protein
MTTFILDSSAVLRYIDNEVGGDRVNALFKACVARRAAMYIPAVQWGEITGRLRARLGASHEERIIDSLLPSELEIVPANRERAVRAARLKVDRKLAFADSFAVELTLDSPEYVLVTADFDLKAVEDLIKIEFLPLK